MTAGGNNVGFASVIANCFVEFAWSMAKCTNQVNAAESKADSTLQETTTFLSHIQNRLADPTHARVILGYPYLVQAGRDTPATKVPATNVRMTEDKFRTKRVETVNAWNKAHTLKVTYASTTTLFTAHELEPFFIGSDNPPIDR